MDFLQPHTERIYAGLRILAGLMFMQHGLQKILGLFGGPSPEAPAFVVYVAGGIELVGGALVAMGLLTRWAAFLCSGLMAAAYFMAHAGNGFWPIENRGELAVLYCWAFFFISAHGAGTWSVDKALGRS